MVQCFHVDGLDFCFDDDWAVDKYDDWSFYRERFSRMWNGIKAIDLLAVSPDDTLYLIEAKNYRAHERTKMGSIPDEIFLKIFSTLAALLPARVNATDDRERGLATRALGAAKLKVVLHLEQPLEGSKPFPRAINPANVQQKLRQLLKPIDAEARVAETALMQGLPWTVTYNPTPAA